MVAVELQSVAYVATASPLSSSFLPKCTRLRQAQRALCSPARPGSHGAVASTKQKKKKKGGSSSSARDWSHEHIMVLWDEVFEQCCTNPVKATHIRDLALRGLAKHGRGCVLVFQEVQTRPRGSGTGFTSKPPRSSRRVPDFITLDYQAVYLPREYLLDPRKAPDESGVASSDEASDGDAQVAAAHVEKAEMDDRIIDVDAFLADALGKHDISSDDDEPDDMSADGTGLVQGSVKDQEEEEDDDDDDDDDDGSFFIPYKDTDAAKATDGLINANESSLLVFDDEAHPVSTMSEVEVQHNEDIIVNDNNVQGNYKGDSFSLPSDCVFEVVQGSSTSEPPEREELARVSVVIDKTGGLHEGQIGADASGGNGAMTNKLALQGWQGGENKEGQSEEGGDVEVATQQMLVACMRGVDMTRLLSLTANFDFEAPRFKFGRKTAMIDVKTMDAGGEDPYNPQHDEVIMLLHLLVDGRPSYGADIVIAERVKELPVISDKPPMDGEKPSWKLRLKHRSLGS